MTILASQCYSKSIVITHSPRILPFSVSLKQAKKHATCQFHMIQNKAFCKGHLHVHPKMKLCSLAQLPGKRSWKPRNLIDSIVFASIQPFQSHVPYTVKAKKKRTWTRKPWQLRFALWQYLPTARALIFHEVQLIRVQCKQSQEYCPHSYTTQWRILNCPFAYTTVKNIAHFHI